MKKALQQKISWLTLIIMFAVSALIYVCPMAMQPHDTMALSSSGSCGQSSGGAVLQNSNDDVGCLGSHLGVAGQTQGSLTDSLSFIFAIIALSIVISYLSTRRFLNNFIRSLLLRLRHRYWRYRTSIKFLKEAKFLRYLTLCGYSVVSI